MRPLLSLHINRGVAPDLDPDQVADMLNLFLDREFAPQVVSVRVLGSMEDLRAYEAGEMVLYRKPARKSGDKIVYERDGHKVELEQTRLAL